MSFFQRTAKPAVTEEPVREGALERAPADKDNLYNELITQRPALLDEKLKLHARIIDEFNLAALEKLPREELVREVRSYLGDYVRTERLTLNQREAETFAEEIVDEMIGFGPIESLLKEYDDEQKRIENDIRQQFGGHGDDPEDAQRREYELRRETAVAMRDAQPMFDSIADEAVGLLTDEQRERLQAASQERNRLRMACGDLTQGNDDIFVFG